MAENVIPLSWFVCPVTKEKLKYKDDKLFSSFGTYQRDKKFGYWDFIPRGLKEFKKHDWTVWSQLQNNACVSYQEDPKHNLGVGKRKDHMQFAKFCKFKGNLLDVGCGPQKIPTHMQFCKRRDVFFVGIDPLIGDQPREFAFVLGLGEYLPFHDKLFDQVLFVTTLDHFINPLLPLKEARRVITTDGEICVWIGEKSHNAPRPQESHEWYDNLEIPKGAENKFHYRKLTALDFENYIKKANLSIKDKQDIEIDKWEKNLFYKLSK